MINCNNFNETISAYIDNELSIEERLSFEAHVKSCRECKRELDEMIRIVDLCTSLPQQELPVDFKAELHEKLVSVAGRQDRQESPQNKVTAIRKPKGFRFLKTFAAVAAGLLVIVLAGSYFKFGLFSPMKTGNTTNSLAMAAEEPAAAKDEAIAQKYGSAPEAEMAGGMEKQANAFSAPAAASDGTAEVDRSARIQNRDVIAAEAASLPETVNNKLSTVTVISDDPNGKAERIKTLALENNAEIIDHSLKMSFSSSLSMKSSEQSDTAQAADVPTDNAGSPARLQLNFILPDTQYDKFVAKLYAEFGAANVQPGALVTVDVTEDLNSLIAESIELDNRIQELQKEEGTKNASEIEALKVRMESTDKQIDELRLGNDFVNVTVFVNGK